jgi:ferritin-like metal-binding protein YciE
MTDLFDEAKGRLFGHISKPGELLEFKLGAALTMENTVLKMLGRLESEAQGGEVKELLRHHADETRGHVRNVEQAFAALGVEADDKPCPTIGALEKEGKAYLKMADDNMVDAVILCGAAETEHHEIGVYENLITLAESLGEEGVVARLRDSLEQERHALEKASRALRTTADELSAQAA